MLSFDAVGTLLATVEPVGVVYSRFAGCHGINAAPDAVEHAFRQALRQIPPPSPEEFAQDDGRGRWHRLVQWVFASAGGVPDVPDRLFEDLYAHYGEASAWRLYPKTRETLMALHGRVRLALFSNFDSRLDTVAAGLGLTQFFDLILPTSRVGWEKPHPSAFAGLLGALGCEACEVLHIGDEREADFAGATASGMSAYHLQSPDDLPLVLGFPALRERLIAG